MNAKRLFQIGALGLALLIAGFTANAWADFDVFPHAVWNKDEPALEIPAVPIVDEADKTMVFETRQPFDYDLDSEDELELYDFNDVQTGDLPERFLLELWESPDFGEALLDPGVEAYLKELIATGVLDANDPALKGIEAELLGGFFRPDPEDELVLFPSTNLQTGDIPDRFLLELGPRISFDAAVLDPGIAAYLNRLIATGFIDLNNQAQVGALLSIESRLRGGLLGRSTGPGLSGGLLSRGGGLLGR